MKKLLVAAFAVFSFAAVSAQDFGLTAGYSNVSFDGEDSASGFNIGAFVDFSVSDTFSIQPELVYTNSSLDDATYNLFSINAMAKYNVSEDFSILAGPQFGFASGDIPDAVEAIADSVGEDFTTLNLRLAIGIAYSFTEEFFAQARYGFQINEHLDGLGAVNVLSLGLGYRF